VCTTHHDPSTLSGGFIIGILKRFDGLVALSEIERKRMLSLGLDGTKIRLIPNGVDIAAFKHLPHRESFRRRMGIQNHLILYAGRIDTQDKGCDVLVEAVSMTQRTIGDCTLVFSGPDWGSQKYLQALCAQRNVRAVFTGNLALDDLKSAFVACDVFVLPSVREAVGLSIIEAMLCGAPVVATRVGGIPSLVQEEETGLLVSPNDPQAMADAICRTIQDRRLAARLTRRGREVAAKYSIERTVTQLEQFYHSILSS
jgi:glycosyltransferase involved in cell wall biosynthesis